VLEFRDVHKSFAAVRALSAVSFSVQEGEVHALVGENGAGKSTLLKILAGTLRPDQGEVLWAGEKLALARPRDALARGIGLVPQETLAFPNLSVSANVFAGREVTGRLGRLREAEMRERTRGLLERLHLPLSPGQDVGSLSAAHRQLVQVARALAFDCRVLVLDEPTTALTDAEAEHLFRIVEDLRQRGVTVLYVSHRLPEVFRLADRITVLRDGRHVATVPRAETTPSAVVRAMVGRDLPPRASGAAPPAAGPPVLRVAGLTRRPHFEDVSLSVAAGESVGLFGLVGSGRSELLECLFGVRRAGSGTVEVGGRPVAPRSPRAAGRAGVALAPEERQAQGLFFNLSLRHNLMLPLETLRGAVLVRARRERQESRGLMERWGIKAAGVDVGPDTLSGGNQRCRRGGQIRDPRGGAPPGGRGHGVPHGLERPPGGAGARAPRGGDARGPRAGGARRRGGRRGEGDAPGHRPARGGVVKGIWRVREVSTVLILLLEIAFFAWYLRPEGDRSHPFLNAANGLLILKYSSIYGIAAIGAAMVIIAGGVDLSPGAVIALSGVVTGGLVVEQGWSLPAGAVAGLLSGLAAGLLAAALVVAVRLPPFIATLGVMGIARGTAFILTEGRYYDVSSALPGGWRPLGIPTDWLAPMVMLALALAFHLAMRGFQWGRAVFAVGGNETAAVYSGVPVAAVKTSVYVAAGLLAAVSGVVLVLVQGQGKADLALGYELDIIASAVVGGASLAGGRGSVLGAVLGTLIFGVLRNALPQVPGATFYDRLIVGVVVIVIVVMDQLLLKRGE
jgi:ABC-type sugar transport system ATPase subunit/ribose/xylose/arabinose/galactoside ABC-type transport system permease subunit